MFYKIKKLCFDSGQNTPPYEDNPMEVFNTFEDAWNFAVELAEQETEYYNQDCDEFISFGIPQDKAYEDKALCRVEYYYNPDNDDTGNTEIVTQYWVRSESELEHFNKLLQEKHGEDITVKICSYEEDDGSTKYYYSTRYSDSDSYDTAKEAYQEADKYLMFI